jgi:hypothetical protein
MPADLVSRCFNCLQSGHIAALCTNAARYLCYHREGHQARSYKHPRSSAARRSARPRLLRWWSSILAGTTLRLLSRSLIRVDRRPPPVRARPHLPGWSLRQRRMGRLCCTRFLHGHVGLPHQSLDLLSCQLARRRLLTSCGLAASSSA